MARIRKTAPTTRPTFAKSPNPPPKAPAPPGANSQAKKGRPVPPIRRRGG